MDDRAAGMTSGETPRRRDTKVSRSKPAKAPKQPGTETARLQLHLPPELVQRLGVHCSMARCSWSAEAARILGQYLATHGKGRELFQPLPEGVDPLAE